MLLLNGTEECSLATLTTISPSQVAQSCDLFDDTFCGLCRCHGRLMEHAGSNAGWERRLWKGCFRSHGRFAAIRDDNSDAMYLLAPDPTWPVNRDLGWRVLSSHLGAALSQRDSDFAPKCAVSQQCPSQSNAAAQCIWLTSSATDSRQWDTPYVDMQTMLRSKCNYAQQRARSTKNWQAFACLPATSSDMKH